MPINGLSENAQMIIATFIMIEIMLVGWLVRLVLLREY